MLTYRTGAAGAPSSARFMSEHLLQQTLSPEMAAMAEYYEQGVAPPTIAEAAAARYGHLAATGMFSTAAELDALARAEAARLAESAPTSDGTHLGELSLFERALAAFTAAGLIDRETALASMGRAGLPFDPPSFDAMVDESRDTRDHSSATATPRRDMNPALGQRLGIDPHRGLTQSEVAFLLNGQRADGKIIEGQTRRAATLSLAQVFGLDPRRRPTPKQLEKMLEGRKAGGDPLPPKNAERAVRRFQSALGAKSKTLTTEERAYILSGRTADGRDLTDRQYQAILETSKARIGYIDLTFSAPKSLSIAWAFAPTKAERAMLHQAHSDAVATTLKEIEVHIGHASKGDSAKHGYEAGSIGWVSFEHYAARPTVEVVRIDKTGEAATELHTLTNTGGRVPGDMQVHTHVAVFNAVETPSGRLGGLDLAELHGRVHEWGALYQAYLAANLRVHGVDVELDRHNEMARLSAIPDSVVNAFSKRTLSGTDAARDYARSQGLDWDRLDTDRKIGLLKSGVQNPREAKSDDVSDLTAWERMARAIGYRHRSVLRPDHKMPVIERAQRLETAYQAAMPLLGKQFDRRAVIDGSDARIAAAKGLIAAGIEAADDVNAITNAFRERGIQRRGEDAALVWGMVNGRQGRERTAITTTLDEREERRLVATVRAGGRDKSAALSPTQINKAVAAFPEINFRDGHGRAQRHIVEQLGTGGRIGLAIGVAGSGKSTLLKPLVRAWSNDGRAVYGVALAWRQSDDLREAGIAPGNTRAVASFLRAAQAGRLALDRKSVIVIDEVGLLGTRQLNDILAVQRACSAQLVMIGDPKQMQSVEAGPVIALLRRALGESAVPELGTSVRQKEAGERETALMFRNGQVADAIKRKDTNGTLHLVPGGYREAIMHVANLWEQRRNANFTRRDYSISVSAPTNAEAHEISLAIRERRRIMREIGPDRVTIKATDGDGWRGYDMALATGDRVRLFARTNARFPDTGTVGNIGRNGTVLDIVKITDEGLTLRTGSGKDGIVSWDTLKDGRSEKIRLAYGDALTTHTAQGSTVTEHIHAMPSGSRLVTGFGAYTSGSRHREQSFIVTSEGAEKAEIVGRRPLGDRREILRADILHNVVRNFSKQPEKESALDMIERASALRRGSIQTMQAYLQPIEARAMAQEQITRLRDHLQNRREAYTLEERLPNIAESFKRREAAMSRFLRAASGLAERLAGLARRGHAKRRSEDAYWKELSRRSPEGLDRSETPVQSRRRGRR